MVIKWGVLSTANIATTQFIPALLKSKDAQLLAIASRGPKVHAVAEQFGIERAYESYEELLQDPDVQAIYIPLPNDLHKEWVFKAAEAGKHIVCEKPATLTASELEEMIAKCKQENVFFMEAFMYQFQPQYARVREIIASGEIGDVRLYQSNHTFLLNNREQDIRMQPSMGGGAIWDVGCYSLHAIQTLLQKNIEQIYTMSWSAPNEHVDTITSMVAQLEDGIQATMSCSFDTANQNTVKIIGTKGIIELEQAFRPDGIGHFAPVSVEVGMSKRTERIYGEIYPLEIAFFHRVLAGEETLEAQHNLSRKNIQYITAAYQSAKEQRLVDLGVAK